MKPLAWLVALVSLIAVGLFCCFGLPSVQDEALTVRPDITGAQQHRSLFGTGKKRENSRPKSAETLRFEQEMDAAKERFKELGERTGAAWTPELNEKHVDLVLRNREPFYQGLFASWDADLDAVDDTMKIIRERNLKLWELSTEFMRQGPDYAREYAKRRQIVNEYAERRLSERLGRKRFDELALMESSQFRSK